MENNFQFKKFECLKISEYVDHDFTTGLFFVKDF